MNAISIQNISKMYHIIHSQIYRRSFREDIMNGLMQTLRFSNRNEKRENFWALKNVSLDIKKGEILGIIGSNGSGKSTLLKILSRITTPTIGKAQVDGNVSALLELGVGFHPDLSGRDNIFLNGAILGYKKQEILREFNQIVEFSGIRKFIDTPVKYYSSGMRLRLGFSVATAHNLEPEILLLDEILTVGDQEFKDKCFKRIKKIIRNANCTVLLVTHNLQAIEDICTRCLLLEKGMIKMIGNPKKVVKLYTESKKI